MLGDRVQEIVDFAKTESPFKSANKGWLTEDVFLKWGSTESKSQGNLDTLAKVSFFWQPIIQLFVLLFIIASLAILVAFTPTAFSKGKFSLITEKVNFYSNAKAENLNINLEPKENNQTNLNIFDESKSYTVKKVVQELKVEPKKVKKMITATDLFQGNPR